MLAKALLAAVGVLSLFALNEAVVPQLPKPNYEAKKSDSAWLQTTVQFHGHLGPAIVAGARLGMAGVRAVDAKGYFDVEIVCEGPFVKPPKSCFLDGIQVGTGATLGKRNLKYVEAKEVVLRVKNTATGKTAEVRPTQKLQEMLGLVDSPEKKPEEKESESKDHHHSEMERIESLARTIAELPDAEIMVVEAKK
jgi:formylmethanofuran dehydrogenase subunit E